MTKRPKRAERIAGVSFDCGAMSRDSLERIYARCLVRLHDAIRGACHMRDLYRSARAERDAERARVAEALRERDEAERYAVDLWDQTHAGCEGVGPDLADEVQPCADDCDCLDDCIKVHAMRARQEQRGKGGGNG